MTRRFIFAQGGRITFLHMLELTGITPAFCLDAGDGDSYDGSSQTWTDATGNGNNFFRGVDGTSEATDPTFSGVAGRKSALEYFSGDGADLFTETASHTFADSWHQNNGICSIFGVVQCPSAGAIAAFTSRGAPILGDANEGVTLTVGTVGINFTATTGVGIALSVTEVSAVSADTPFFFACSINEATGANGLALQMNTSITKHTSTYASPSANPASGRYRIGASGNVVSWDSGARIYCLAGVSAETSDDERNELYARLKRRFSTLP